MRKCTQCGGRLRRIHRSFVEHFRYMALHECRDCKAVIESPRRWALHTGPACRCPLCGTYRVTRLKTPDRIDRFQHGLLNLLERMASGKLYHCRFCRVQFFDRRPLITDLGPPGSEDAAGGPPPAAMNPPGKARSDA
jgi:hypothetical protein